MFYRYCKIGAMRPKSYSQFFDLDIRYEVHHLTITKTGDLITLPF